MKHSVNDYFSGTEEEQNNNISIPISTIADVSKLIFDKVKTQLDIVQFAGLKPPTVSITLKKMEKEGLVTRTPDTYDLRAVRVSITEKGRELFMKSVRSVYDMEERIMQGISHDEINSLMKVLNKIKDNLEAID